MPMQKNANTIFTIRFSNEVNIKNKVLFIATVMNLSRINRTLLTIGCIFRFCTVSLSFFHEGIVLSFSLRSACSSKIGLTKKDKD